MRPITRETIIDRRQAQLRWGAVFGGTVLAIGLWILLQTLGMGLGLSAVRTDDAGNLKGVGIGTGIWSVIAPLIALFIGAFVAARLSASRDRKVGAMHGSVIWGLAIAVGLWAMLTLVSTLASGVARVGGVAASAGASIASGAVKAGAAADGQGAMSALGIDTNDLVAPINRRLEQAGKPPITAEQLNATVRAVAQRGLHEGKLDRTALVEEIARNTSLSRADAEDVANQIEAKYEQASSQVGSAVERVGEGAKHAALVAADKTGKALLLGGIMMLLSLAAAIAGGALGVPRFREREETVVTTPTPPPTIITPPPPVA